MVRVWKTKWLLLCLRYDPLIVFRKKNHTAFIFIKMMSHDLLVQMPYWQLTPTTPIDIPQLALYLRDHPDRVSVDAILIGLFQGFKLVSSVFGFLRTTPTSFPLGKPTSWKSYSLVTLLAHSLLTHFKMFRYIRLGCPKKVHLRVDNHFKRRSRALEAHAAEHHG